MLGMARVNRAWVIIGWSLLCGAAMIGAGMAAKYAGGPNLALWLLPVWWVGFSLCLIRKPEVPAQACASPTAGERRSWRNIKACFWWSVLFTATFLIGGQIFKYADWAPEGLLAWGLSLVPVIPGAMAFRAFLRFFRETDEMIREIYVEGMLFGVAAVMAFWGAIQLPEHVWLEKIEASVVVLVMLAGFGVGTIRANWRRR